MKDFAAERAMLSRTTAILLDDEPASIAEHVEVARTNNVNVVVVKSLVGLRDELFKDENWWPILFLDMHMPGIKDLGEIGYPSIKTASGNDVGLAIARGFLPAIHKQDLPTRILSGYEISSEARREVERANRRGGNVGNLRKQDVKLFFEELLLHIGQAPISQSRSILGAEQILSEWASGDEAVVAAALGYPGQTGTKWAAMRANLLRNPSQDTRDRADIITYIKIALARLFREEAHPGREAAWLQTADPNLGSSSPWQLMTSGHLHDLGRVGTLMARIVE